MLKWVRDLWWRRRKPKFRSTYRERGPLEFRAEHRAGRPVVNHGIGSHTRPLHTVPVRPARQAPGLDSAEASQET
jgi:hypothetical protein